MFLKLMYLNITQSSGRINSYEFNHFTNATTIETRVGTCIEVKRFSKGRSEYWPVNDRKNEMIIYTLIYPFFLSPYTLQALLFSTRLQ